MVRRALAFTRFHVSSYHKIEYIGTPHSTKRHYAELCVGHRKEAKFDTWDLHTEHFLLRLLQSLELRRQFHADRTC